MTTATITLNGKPRDLAAGTVLDLLAAEGYDAGARGIAVARNGAVVPRSAWAATALSPGDTIEIVKIMQGG